MHKHSWIIQTLVYQLESWHGESLDIIELVYDGKIVISLMAAQEITHLIGRRVTSTST